MSLELSYSSAERDFCCHEAPRSRCLLFGRDAAARRCSAEMEVPANDEVPLQHVGKEAMDVSYEAKVAHVQHENPNVDHEAAVSNEHEYEQ